MKKIKSILAVTMIMIMSLTVFTACGSKEEEKTGEFGAFKAVTFDGDEITESVFADAEVTMLNVWGTFCGPCIGEMPDLEEINQEYSGKDFQLLGVIIDKDEPGDAEAQDVIDKTGVTYSHIMNSPDLDNTVLGDVQAVPTTLFIDKDGKIIKTVVGGKDKDDWKAIIDEVMETVK